MKRSFIRDNRGVLKVKHVVYLCFGFGIVVYMFFITHTEDEIVDELKRKISFLKMSVNQEHEKVKQYLVCAQLRCLFSLVMRNN